MTNAEARFNKSLRPRKPEGSLGRTAQDGHLDSHTAPELYTQTEIRSFCFCLMSSDAKSILGTIQTENPGFCFYNTPLVSWRASTKFDQSVRSLSGATADRMYT